MPRSSLPERFSTRPTAAAGARFVRARDSDRLKSRFQPHRTRVSASHRGARAGPSPDMALRRAARATAGLTATAAATALAFQGFTNASDVQLPKDPWSESSTPLPSRDATVRALRRADERFDVLVVGGGATGAGCAVDAATRGLSVALVEGEDFGAGTSGRSTKLVHGGVRYLEKAVFQLDPGQLKLVFEALRERKTLLNNAPHLTRALPIATPCYRWWEVPYYWAGMKAYDLVAGTQGLTMSRFTRAGTIGELFPQLAQMRTDIGEKSMKGAIVYYDGQFDDARLNVALACTAAHAGAAVVNHTRVVKFHKEGKRVVGVRARDVLTGGEYDIYAKAVINASGPFTDELRRLSNEEAAEIMMPSAGVHLTLPAYYCPNDLGLIIPKTKDGRVVFMLPWLGACIAGTTDSKCDVTMTPSPTKYEVEFILESIAPYLKVDARRSDILSAWSGIRPLAADPGAKNTENMSRDHVIAVEKDGMVTVTGGKWTTYRRMAEEAVDKAIQTAGLTEEAGKCRTHTMGVVGAHGYTNDLFVKVAQRGGSGFGGPPDETVAKHLAHSYGDRALVVADLAAYSHLSKRLVPNHPVIEAEVVYAARAEYCQTATDFLARRTRLAFLDVDAAERALPRVVALLGAELKWGYMRRRRELAQAKTFLSTFKATS